MAAAPGRGRRYDPDRRQRIVDAAIRVVEQGGIAALSHRSAAREADVPLGSTTYHFATLDDLLGAALRQVNGEWLAGVEAWERGLPPDAPLADEVTRYVESVVTRDRARVELEYDLYLAALRREAVRPLAADCLDHTVRLLRRRTPDDASARALAALIDGLVLQLLLTGRPFDAEETRAAVAGVIGGPESADG
ncbi:MULTISPECIES: TetR/AcrR family transcriptional regulator [Streptomyces]|uniref:TetR family transcriptional regulator n=1 Tax=Streptomyces lycii TaxID=2654337 RepID=A0ABQ7FLR8_9ACTN|nr:TetR family transcriptional regulator C-terminal domain-containing protein [Streptomyces lycii]KAF4409340.1 TetR family transcriptional regulator [Streptomyces lycii]